MFSVCHGGTWANPLHFSVYDVNEIGSTSKWVNQQHLILYVINEIGNTLHPCGSLTMATWNQSGAVEAWWAHNPQVQGSKPGSNINVRGKLSVTISSGLSNVSITQSSQEQNLAVEKSLHGCASCDYFDVSLLYFMCFLIFP